MIEEKKEESKEEVEQTTAEENSTQENNDNQSTVDETTQKNEAGEEQEEWTPPSQEEFEKLQKKATDFDGIIEKQRLQKLQKKEAVVTTATETDEEKKEEVEVSLKNIDKIVEQKMQEKMQELGQQKTDDLMRDVYKEFIKENPWADSDQVIETISQRLDTKGATTDVQLRARLDAAAQMAHPIEFKKSYEDSIRRKLLADQDALNAGDGGGGGGSIRKDGKGVVNITDRQREIAIKSGNNPEEVYK